MILLYKLINKRYWKKVIVVVVQL